MEAIKPKVDGQNGKFDMNKWIEGKKKSGEWVGSDEPNPKLSKPKTLSPGGQSNYSPR